MTESNTNARLQAFCDGVFAIALTLLVIDLRLPSPQSIHTTDELWLALRHLLPSIFAFLLSFVFVFIAWVGHHSALKLVDRSSPAFMYANGFLLLTIVVIPFPTSLLGDFLFTDHAAPAVVVYTAVNLLSAIGWVLVAGTALKPPRLTKDEKAAQALQVIHRSAFSSVAVYIICVIVAFWYPLTIAVVISAIWIVWLIIGINAKSE